MTGTPAAGTPAAGAPAAGAAGGTAGGGNILGGDDSKVAGGAAGAPAADAGKGAGAGEAGKDAKPAAGTPPDAKAAEAAKAAADKAAADDKASELVLKVPEGFKEDASFSKFKELAKTHGLKAEGAQAIVDLYAEAQKAQHAQMVSQREQQTKEWDQSVRSDKEFGGAKYDQTVQDARKALRAYGGAELAELKQMLQENPIGNWPPLVKLLARVGRAASEDVLEGGSGSERAINPGNNKDALHKAMYPKSFEKMNGRK